MVHFVDYFELFCLVLRWGSECRYFLCNVVRKTVSLIFAALSFLCDRLRYWGVIFVQYSRKKLLQCFTFWVPYPIKISPSMHHSAITYRAIFRSIKKEQHDFLCNTWLKTWAASSSWKTYFTRLLYIVLAHRCWKKCRKCKCVYPGFVRWWHTMCVSPSTRRSRFPSLCSKWPTGEEDEGD